MDTTSTPNKPLATYRDGKLKATLWANQSRDGDTFYNVTLSRVYEDRNGKLQENNSFSDTEIPRLKDLAGEARMHALHLRREQNLERNHQNSRDQGQSRGDGGTPERFQDRADSRNGPGMER